MNNSKFPIEDIPDDATLYCRVHFANIDKENAKIKPAAFDPTPYDNPDGLSVNWSKYCLTPDQARQGSRKLPNEYGVVSFIVQKVREIPLGVVHDPDDNNQAHSLILDIPPRKQNDAKIKMCLLGICKWEIHYKENE